MSDFPARRELDLLLEEVNCETNRHLWFLKAFGLIVLLQRLVTDEQWELAALPVLDRLERSEETPPRGRFPTDDGQFLEVDPADQLPLLEFLALLDQVAAISHDLTRLAALHHIAMTVLSVEDWVCL